MCAKTVVAITAAAAATAATAAPAKTHNHTLLGRWSIQFRLNIVCVLHARAFNIFAGSRFSYSRSFYAVRFIQTALSIVGEMFLWFVSVLDVVAVAVVVVVIARWICTLKTEIINKKKIIKILIVCATFRSNCALIVFQFRVFCPGIVVELHSRIGNQIECKTTQNNNFSDRRFAKIRDVWLGVRGHVCVICSVFKRQNTNRLI